MDKQPLYIRDTTGKIISIPHTISNESYEVAPKGTLYTSYFAKLKQGKGIKFSVARYNPKWLKEGDIDGWLPHLSPSESLLKSYKNNLITWDEYTKEYFNRLFSRADLGNCLMVRKEIDAIKNVLDIGKDITLYCYEKPTDNCHRHLLGGVFKEIGYEVKEIE